MARHRDLEGQLNGEDARRPQWARRERAKQPCRLRGEIIVVVVRRDRHGVALGLVDARASDRDQLVERGLGHSVAQPLEPRRECSMHGLAEHESGGNVLGGVAADVAIAVTTGAIAQQP